MKGANLNVYRTVEVHTKDEKLKYRKTERSKSLTIAFLQIFEALSFPTDAVTIKDYLGASKMVTDHADDFNMNGGVGLVNKGIVVGTGTTTPDNLDYVMETPIAHGAGAGELNYGAMAQITTSEVGANVDFIAYRAFTNNSGGTINVTEFGVYAWGYSGGDFIFLIIHDVTSAVEILNTETLTVTYTFRTTV